MRLTTLCFTVLCGLVASAHAEIVVRDDTGQEVRLKQPAQRIVSLAPHVTETLYAAGAGERMVGTVEYSDYPEAAKKLPRVGGYVRVNLEAIVGLKPDLVVAWKSGNSAAHIEKLRGLGIPVFISQPDRMDDVAKNLEAYGQLLGNSEGAQAASNFRKRLADLRSRYGQRPKVRVFYQIWKEPLMTVGASQIISDAIRLCSGDNVFGNIEQMAPRVTVEAVLATNPEAIVASGMGDARPEWLDDWRRWPKMTAIARNNLFFIPPDLIQRHTPRMLDGAERLCQHLETARSRRP